MEYLTDSCSHSKTDIGVDVDLTYCHGSCLAELLLGNTNCIGKLSAQCIDDLYALRCNRGSTVKNDRELRESLLDLCKNVKTKRRGNQNALLVSCALLGCELICAV